MIGRAPAVLAASLLLLVALVCGCGQENTQSQSTEKQPDGLASAEIATMLSNRIRTFNEKGGEAVAAFYADDAVLEEQDQEPSVVTVGTAKIGPHMQEYWLQGMRLESKSVPIQLKGLVAETLTFPDDSDWIAIAVYEIDDNGKIAHQWVISPH